MSLSKHCLLFLMMFHAGAAYPCEPCGASLTRVGFFQVGAAKASRLVAGFTLSVDKAPVGIFVYKEKSGRFIDPAHAQLERLVGDVWTTQVLVLEDFTSSTRATKVKPGRSLSFKVDLRDAIFVASAFDAGYDYRLTVFLDNGCRVSSEPFRLPNIRGSQ